MLGVKIWNLVPIFTKLVNFGPNILALLESPREALQAAQSLWAKVQKQKVTGGGSNSDDNSDFLEIGELWSTYILTLLESPREGLQVPKILWAKVQKQKSYWVINFWTLVPILPKLVNFGPHVGIFEKPREGSTTSPNIVDQSSKTRKLLEASDFELWSRFSRNRWTLVHMFWHSRKSLETSYKLQKFCGPKFKNNKVIHQKP